MKIGQKVLVVETGFARDSLSSEYWTFYGELAERFRISYGKVTEAINFSISPFKRSIKSGQLELCFDGIVLVKILHCDKAEWGVGVFWVRDINLMTWRQMGYVCLLSDIEGKRYLRRFIDIVRRRDENRTTSYYCNC